MVAYLRSAFRDAEAAREMSHAFFDEMLGGGAIRTAGEGKVRWTSKSGHRLAKLEALKKMQEQIRTLNEAGLKMSKSMMGK